MTEHKQDESHCFRVSVSALIIEDGHVLLAHRRAIDWWNLPGGAVEPGETVAEGLRREVREETGLEIQVGQLIGVYSKPRKQEVVLSFRCQVIGGMLGIANDDDIDESRYFPLNNLPARLLPKHHQRVADALLNQPQAILRDQLSTTEQDQGLF